MIPSRPGTPRDEIVRGIGAMLVAVTLFSVMTAICKALTEAYPLAEVVFFRNAFGILPPLLVLAGRKEWRALHTHRLLGHILRATIGVTAMALSFWSFHLLPLADATALSFSAPLFLTALSVPVLGEKVGRHRWGAVLVGFLGVIVIARPSGAILNSGFLVAVAAAFAAALAAITLRQLGKTEPAVATVFYFSLFATLYSVPLLPSAWTAPDWRGLAMLAAMGVIGGTAQQYMTIAYALVPAAVISPFTYAGIIWASLLGWLFWDDIPSANVLGGAAIVIASGLYILYRETRRRQGGTASGGSRGGLPAPPSVMPVTGAASAGTIVPSPPTEDKPPKR